jgi:hypothetical protein
LRGTSAFELIPALLNIGVPPEHASETAKSASAPDRVEQAVSYVTIPDCADEVLHVLVPIAGLSRGDLQVADAEASFDPVS